MRRSGYVSLLFAAILLSSRPDAAFVPAPRHPIAATPRASSPARSSPAPVRARVQPMHAIARHADAAPMVPMQLPAGRAATTTTLNVTPNPSGIFEPTTMTATVAVVPPAVGTPAGVVRFRSNGSIIGSAPLSPGGVATFTTGLPVTGTLNLTASYVGGPEFAPSTSDVVPHEVAAATASTLTLLVTSPSPSAAATAVTAIAIVIPLSGGVPTGNVQFRDGATSIGSSALTTASGLRLAFVSFTPASAGLHTLTAQYAGDATFAASTSAPAVHTVYAGAAPSATTTTLTSAPASSFVGQAVTLTATVTRTAGGLATGTVDFYALGRLLGSGTLAAGGGAAQATLTVSSLPKGLALISAAYRGAGTSAASATGFPVFQCVDCTAANATPLAEAGPIQAVTPGSVVQLDGSASSDLEGSPLTYTWTSVTTSPFTAATLSNPTSARPTFVAAAGETYYAFDLVVSDGVLSSPADRVYVIATSSFTNAAPVANAGADQFLPAGQSVTLSGTLSFDPDGQPAPLSYRWIMRSAPAGSTAELSDPTASSPTFFRDLDGRYEFELVVFDGATLSAPDRVVVATNHPPVARAGEDQERLLGSTAYLSGAESTDDDEQRLTYQWTMMSRPALSAAVLTDPTAVAPSFVLDRSGDYVLRLVVSDGADFSDPDFITVSTGDLPPVANPGPARLASGATPTSGALSDDRPVISAAVGETVRLDGTASFDPNFQFGSALSYLWTLVLRPAGSAAVLAGPTSPRPTFVADVAGDYVVRLAVTSGTLSSAPRQVRIRTGNSRPTAQVVVSPETYTVGSKVTVDGTGSTDLNGDELAYSWSFLKIPDGVKMGIKKSGSPRFSFTPPTPGDYVVQFRVDDGEFVDSAAVLITVDNAAPIGRAGADQAVPLSPVTLDGRASTDANFDPLSYRWQLVRRPTGSAAALTNPTTAQPTFTTDAAGDYIAQLRVSDGARYAPIDTVLVTTGNAVPLANAGADRNVSVDEMVSLDGTDSSDANGTPLTYQWSMLYRPGASAAVLSNATTSAPAFLADAPGTYVFQLIVSDGIYRSAPDTVVITTVNAPTAVAIAPDTAYAGQSVPLDGSASSDPQSLPLTYLWSFGSRPAGSVASIENPLAPITAFTPDLVGTYAVCLVVGNGAVSSTPACRSVLVSAAPALVLSPSVLNLARNETASMTVTLNQPAGPSGVTVALEAAGTAAVTVVPSVAIPAGETSATFDVHAGALDGTATIAATAAGYVGDLAHVNVSVSGITITLGSGLVVAPQQIRDLSLTLSEPAPAGGVLITLTSSNPAIASVTPSIFVPEGADVPMTNPQVAGLAYGMTEITATATDIAGDTEIVAVARSISLSPATLTLVANGTGTLLLQASAPAPAGGLGFNVTSNTPGVLLAPSTVTIPANQLTAPVTLTGQALGTSSVTVTPTDATDTSSATSTVTVSAAQPINLGSVTVGQNLQTWMSGSLGAPAPVGGRTVTITSGDGSLVLLAANDADTGSEAIQLTVPPGSTQLPPFLVRGRESSGAVVLTAASTGLPNGTGTVTLAPVGFVFGAGNFVTGLFSPNTELPVYAVRLDPATFVPVERQQLQPGLKPALSRTNSNPAVGTLSGFTFTASRDLSLTFDPLSAGTARLGLVWPVPTASGTEITVTVTAPLTFSPSALSVGRNLQAPVSVNLGSPAPAGNLPVTITSTDPSKVLLSKTATGIGSASITLIAPAGSSATPSFFVQALDQGFTVPVNASAANFNPAELPVTVLASGVVFATSSFTTHPAAPDTTLTLATAYLEPGTLEYIPGVGCERCQAVRGGFAPFDVMVSSSSNPIGSVPNPATFNAGSATTTTAFDPHTAGPVTLSIGAPASFSTPANGTQIQATITPATATLSAGGVLIGKNLQTSQSVSLGEPAPAGNLLVTIQSMDPSRVLLSTTPTSPGMDTITVMVPAGQSSSPQFSVHALDDTGTGLVNLTAPGYTDGSFDVTLRPSGVVFRTGSFSTSTLSPDTPLEIRSVWLDPGTLASPADPFCTRCQPLRTGVTAEVVVQSLPTSVGTITISPVVITPSTGIGTTAFHPLSGGSAALTVLGAPGFSTPSTFREITATVDNPALSIPNLTAGKDLQVSTAVTLGAPAEPGGVSVTVSTTDPNVLLSTTPTTAGSSSITLNVGAGATQTPGFYVQALTGTGAAQLNAIASGYTPAASTVSFRPSGFVFVSGDFITGALSPNTTLTLRSVWLDPISLTFAPDPSCTACQPVRGGISPVFVNVISSNPSVGTITAAAVFNGGDATATTAFDPQANGTSTLTIESPVPFGQSGNFAAIVATVQPAVAPGAATVGRDLETLVGGSITAPAPAGNLLVTLESSDPSKLLLSNSPTAPGQATITVLVNAGGSSFSYYVQALAGSGSAHVFASAPGHTSGDALIALVPSGFAIDTPGFTVSPSAPNVPLTIRSVRLDPDFLNYLADPFCTPCQPVRPGIDVVAGVTSSNEAVGTIVGTAPFTGGIGSAIVHFDPHAIGTTTVALGPAPAPFATPSNRQAIEVVVEVPPPSLTIPALTVGKNLQAPSSGSLGAPAPAGNLTVTISSADPDKVLLSSSPTMIGAGSITVVVPAGSMTLPDFYVQALSDIGVVPLTISAPGYLTGNSSVNLWPSGFVIDTASFTTSPTAAPRAIQVRSVRVDPTFHNFTPDWFCSSCQNVRAGVTVDVPVTSADTGIGTITLSPLTFDGNDGTKTTAFDGVAAGVVTVSLTAPDGFAAPSNQQSIDVTVTNSYISLSQVTVGKNLQAQILGSLGEPAPAGNLTITIASGDPAKMLVSNSSSLPGSASITVTVPAGSATVPTFYVQALDNTGQVPLEASAPGYVGNPVSETLVPSGFAFMIPNTFTGPNDDFTTTTSSNNTLLTIHSVRLDPVTLNVPAPVSFYCFTICQPLRPGITASVAVTSSDTAVAAITNSPLTIDHTMDSADAVFDPLAAGSTTVSIVAPAGFSAPGTRGSLVATVTAPPLTIAAKTIGKNLQVGATVQLGAPAPPGNLQVTITSADPSKVLLSATAAAAGSPSIVVTVPAGASTSPTFFVQALSDAGVVDVTASATGYAAGSGAVTLQPSGFILSLVYWCLTCFIAEPINTTAGAANTPFWIASARLDPATLNFVEAQNVRGGFSVDVTVSTTPTGAGTVVPTPVTITGGDAFESGVMQAAFDPSAAGTTVLEALTPPGFSQSSNVRTITVNVTNAALTVASAGIGRNLQVATSVSLGEPAPAGGLDVTVTSADPARLIVSADPAVQGSSSITVHAAEGQSGITVYAQALGDAGSVLLTASAPGRGNGSGTMALSPAGFILTQAYWCIGCFGGTLSTTTGAANSQLYVVAAKLNAGTGNYETSQNVRGGLTVDVTVSSTATVGTNVIAMVPSSVTFTGGTAFDSSVAGIQADPLNAGTSILEVVTPAGFAASNNARQITATVTGPSLAVGDVAIGRDLQNALGVGLQEPAPAGGVDVTLQSADASKVLISADPAALGAASAIAHVPEGSSSATFYVQALASSGTVGLTATAPGFSQGVGSAALQPSGFIITQAYWCIHCFGATFTTTTGSPNTPLDVVSARLHPGTLAYDVSQPVRGGITVNVTVQSADSSGTNVGTMTPSTVSFTGNVFVVPTAFDPANPGTAVIEPLPPAGFSTPTTFRNLTANVTAPGITLSIGVVGKDLQTTGSGTLAAPAPPGGLAVTLVSSDPARLRLALAPTDPGGLSITMDVIEGGTSLPTFYVQALDGTGTVDVTATASGYTAGTTAVPLAPSGFLMLSPGSNFTTTTLSDPTVLSVYPGALTSALTYLTNQPVRPGASVAVTVTAVDSTGTAVGTIAGSPVTFNGNEGVHQVFFDPNSPGSSIITVQTPAGFSTPGNYRVFTATVTAPRMFVGDALLGKDLQTAMAGTLDGVAASDVTLTITSSDPSKVLVSALPTSAGAASIMITSPGPTNVIPAFYVQGLADSGTVVLNITAPGFLPTTAHVTLTPSGFIISSPGSFTTQGNAASTEIQIASARLNPGTLTFQTNQPLRPGATASVPITSSVSSVGAITGNPVVFTGNQGIRSTFFDPQPVASDGSTTIQIATPVGFSTPSQYQQITATVTAVTIDPNATSNYAQWLLGAPAAPNVATFEAFAAGTILTGQEYASIGMSIVQRDGFPMRVANANDGTFVQPQNFNSPVRGVTSSFIDDSKSENYDFVFAHTVTSAGLWIGHLNPEGPSVPVQFLDAADNVLQTFTATAADPNIVGAPPYDTRLFVGLNSATPIAKIRVFNGVGDGDGIVFDDITFSGTFTSLALTPGSSSVGAGATTSLQVSISQALPADATIALSSSDPASVSVPSSVVIPSGATSASFDATGVASGGALITATAPGAASAKAVVAVGGNVVEWISNASGNWSQGSNWSGGLAPTANDTVRIDRPASITVLVDGPAAARTLLASDKVTIVGPLSIQNAAAFDEGFTLSGTLQGSGRASSRGQSTWTHGTLGLANGLDVEAGQRLSITTGNDHHLTSSALRNHGTVSWDGGVVYVNTGGTILNDVGAYWEARGNLQVGANANGANAFMNLGTLRKTAGTGTLTLGGGGLQVTNGATGTIDIQTGNIVNATGVTLVSSGRLSAATNSTIFLHDVTLQAGSTFAGAGTFSFNGTTTIAGNLAFPVHGVQTGQILGAGRLVVSAPYDWNSGTIGLGGGIEIAAGTTLFIATGNDHHLTSSPLRNRGTAQWSGGVIYLDNGGSILNEASGLWDAQGNLQMAANANGTNTFTNAGTFRKSSGTGTFTFGGGGIIVSNQGTFDLQSGSLVNASGVTLTNSGLLSVAGGATVFLHDVSLLASSTFSGSGTLVANGTTTITGTLNVGLPLTISNTLIGSGGIEASAPVTWNSGTIGNGGGLTMNSGSMLSIATGNDHHLASAALRNRGSVVWTGGVIYLDNGASIINELGSFDVGGNLQLAANGNGTNTFTNSAVLAKSAGTGTFTIGSGSLQFDNTNTGSVTIQQGTMAVSGATFINSGALNPGPGATVQLHLVTLNGSSTFGDGGTLLFNGTTTVNGNVNMFVRADITSTVSGPGQLTAYQPVTWSSGSISLGGGFTVQGGAEITIQTGNDHRMTGTAFHNFGRTNWLGGVIYLENGTQFFNESTGVFDIKGNLQLAANGNGTNVFTNAGTVTKSAGTGLFTIGSGSVAFNNSATGTIDVQTGGVFVNGGTLSNSGHVTVATDTTFFMNLVTLLAGSSYSGAGLLHANGTTTVTGDVTVGAPIMLTGTLSGSGRLTAAAPFNWASGSVSMTGGLDIDNGQTLTMANTSDKTLSSSVLRNRGVATWSTGTLFVNNGSSVLNDTTGTWQFNGDVQMSANSNGSAVFTNAGTMKSLGAFRQFVVGNGGLVFTNTGTIEMRLGGNAVPGYDRITSSSRMNLGGTLDVKLSGAFVPATTDEFTILNHAERVGTFGTINGNGQTYAVCYGAATTKLGSPANAGFCGGS